MIQQSRKRRTIVHNGIAYSQKRLPIPQQISGLVFWVDASDGATLYQDDGLTTPAGDGDTIGGWTDKSVSGADVTQADTDKEPLYTTGTLVFDGTNDRMELTIASITTHCIVAAIETGLVQTGFRGLFSGGGATPDTGAMLLARTTAAPWGTYNGTVQSSGTTLAADTKYVLTMNDGDFYTDGVSDGTYASTQGQSPNHVGGVNAQEFDGKINEIVVYDRALSAGERVQIENYLIGKWGTG